MTEKYVFHLYFITTSTLLILKKSEIFITFFADQCSVIPSKSVLLSQLTLLTENSLCIKDVIQIIRQLDSNKAYGHDMIRIRTLKLCGDPICKPLELIFKTCLRNGRFLLEWKKVYALSIHKKGDKQIIKNYRPVPLLPICGKIFERLLYDTMFDFFSKNNLFSPNRSGFRPGDSCISQLFQLIMKS